MNRRDVDDAATLLTLLHHGKRPSSVRAVLSGWDMLQADVPSRTRIEAAASILVGSGLAEVDSSWGMLLTEQGRQVRRSVRGAGGMRSIPGAIGDLLAGSRLGRAPLALPPSVFDAAHDDYRDAARRRADREARRSRHRRWWPAAPWRLGR